MPDMIVDIQSKRRSTYMIEDFRNHIFDRLIIQGCRGFVNSAIYVAADFRIGSMSLIVKPPFADLPECDYSSLLTYSDLREHKSAYWSGASDRLIKLREFFETQLRLRLLRGPIVIGEEIIFSTAYRLRIQSTVDRYGFNADKRYGEADSYWIVGMVLTRI